MTIDATLQTTATTRHEASSTAWFWWKETRQLAPLVLLLIIVALMIVLLNIITEALIRSAGIRLPNEVVMLVFPGLFATGAGPLLVGQERMQRTLQWLSLLPITAKRLLMTKFLVALAGLTAMWCFAGLVIVGFGLGSPTESPWQIGGRTSYSTNPFSYPVWIVHSLYILLAGFYVAWRIKNQFYSLVALIPLAFAPIIMTSITGGILDRPLMHSELDWMNLGFTLLGIAVIAPLTYWTALHALGADAAPALSKLGSSALSPAQILADGTAPKFGTRIAPIIWQSIHSASGSLAILAGMILISLFAAMRLASIRYLNGIDNLLPPLLLAAPLAICWLGVGVFKHDGSAERVRFLADRGVSPRLTYLALHAVPLAILAAAMILYGLWNLAIPHNDDHSAFAETLPTLITLLVFAAVLYSVSQWTSQFVRTLILSVILAPILAAIIAGWLFFSFTQLGFSLGGLVICALAPVAATFFMMRRYMDSRDRPLTFVVGGLVVALIFMLPIASAAWRIGSIPNMAANQRAELLDEARIIQRTTRKPIGVSIRGIEPSNERPFDFERDPIKDIAYSLNGYSVDPTEIIRPIDADQLRSVPPATVDYWGLDVWYGNFHRAQMRWQQADQADAFDTFKPWLTATAKLLVGLRQSTQLSDQEAADRMEVLLIDTLAQDQMKPHSDDAAVRLVNAALGTPASRSQARRRAVLAQWYGKLTSENERTNWRADYLQHEPRGLIAWIEPRRYEQYIMALLDGATQSQHRSGDDRWLHIVHDFNQSGGIFSSSRYGQRMRAMPAIETMTLGQLTGYAQLWGRDWEFANPDNSPTSNDAE
ncbi:hypothetical protein NHH03_12870 [Stieleria sp. TO1_6]|uniref:hypothetical protein n=1 Tax=Stieleria tagensis TaxID=2956795 RepID=UPI00209B4F1C|nr:hypothetical protein [Stieleria tagensis]MCO8122632.1 hypothetical protein [Stieleria tagensis]